MLIVKSAEWMFLLFLHAIKNTVQFSHFSSCEQLTVWEPHALLPKPCLNGNSSYPAETLLVLFLLVWEPMTCLPTNCYKVGCYTVLCNSSTCHHALVNIPLLIRVPVLSVVIFLFPNETKTKILIHKTLVGLCEITMFFQALGYITR